MPSNFLYETSVRGEQGFIGRAARLDGAGSLLQTGRVQDPVFVLRAALPSTQVEVKRWGIKYFESNWSRYQTVLEANFQRGSETMRCRLAVPETPVGAPTLEQLRANEGAIFKRQLDTLLTQCLSKVK